MVRYSIVSFLNNPVSDEKIACGLIFSSDNFSRFRFSQSKMEIIRILNPENYAFFEKAILHASGTSDFELLQNRGVLHISSPKILIEENTQESFDWYFSKWIENKNI